MSDLRPTNREQFVELAERGVPAINLGPGDATLAHTAEEHVHRSSIERAHAVLDDLLSVGP